MDVKGLVCANGLCLWCLYISSSVTSLLLATQLFNLIIMITLDPQHLINHQLHIPILDHQPYHLIHHYPLLPPLFTQ